MSALGDLLGWILLIFQLVLIARLVLDWVGVLSTGGAGWTRRARSVTHTVTEPVLAPAQREVELVADARAVRELARRDHALHARAELDEHVVAIHADHRASPHLERVSTMVLLGRRIPPRFSHRASSLCSRC